MKVTLKNIIFLLSVIILSVFIYNSNKDINRFEDDKPITYDLLDEQFPDAKFYLRTLDQTLPPGKEIIGFYKGKEYSLPDEFNQFILDYGYTVSNENKINLAKTFIIVSRPYDYSSVNFTDISVEKTNIGNFEFSLIIKTYSIINGVVDEWYFSSKNELIDIVLQNVTDSLSGEYIESPDIPYVQNGTRKTYTLK